MPFAANLAKLPEETADQARMVLDRSPDCCSTRPTPSSASTLEATKIRCHGDYHLGQVLRAGR